MPGPPRGRGRGVGGHAKGYLQITHRGPWRNWLVHRKVMLEMCMEMCYYPLPMGKNGHPTLPEGFTVEHCDHHRQHNCPENLMLLDKRIHDWISLEHSHTMLNAMKTVYEVEEETPEWVTNE